MNHSCPDYLPLIHQYLDDELTRAERDDLLLHLDSCEHCRQLLEDYRRIAGELRAMPIEIPPTLHRDIMGYVRQSGPVPWWRRRVLRHAAALAACAALLALVLLGPLRPTAEDEGQAAAPQDGGALMHRFSAEALPTGLGLFTAAPYTASAHMLAQAEAHGATLLLAAAGEITPARALADEYAGITFTDYGEDGAALIGELDKMGLDALCLALWQGGFVLYDTLLDPQGTPVDKSPLEALLADDTMTQPCFIIITPLP